MRVMQIIPTFGMGGAERVVLNYLRSSRNLGIDMRAISLYPPTRSQYDSIIKNEELDVRYLSKKKGYDFSIIKALNKEIEEFKPDVIHTHLHSLKYVMLCRNSKKISIFHTIHNPPTMDTTKFDRVINRWFYRNGRVVPITLHEKLAESVNSYYGIDNTKIVYNAIFLNDYENSGMRDAKRKELRLVNNFVIGNVGSFKKQKNHKFLIKIFAEIRKKRDDAVLLLIGDGPLKADIQELVRNMGLSNYVVFLGNRGDIIDLMQTMDVFVLPSRYEGLGIVAIEAQIADLRCVISDVVPTDVIVSQRVNRLSLDAPMDEWVNKVLSGGNYERQMRRITDYDSFHVLEKLIKVYEGELKS